MVGLSFLRSGNFMFRGMLMCQKSMLVSSGSCASFQGTLDITALGGAGFASQRTTGEDSYWDLSKFDALEIVLDVSKGDDKKYTFNVKDELLPKNPEDGREQSTISWEYDFVRSEANPTSDPQSTLRSIVIPWTAFRPTYRGRPKDDARPLKTHGIRRFSIMIRRYIALKRMQKCFG